MSAEQVLLPHKEPKHMLPSHLPGFHTLRNYHTTFHPLLRTSPDILLCDSAPSWNCPSLVLSQAMHGTGSSPSVMTSFNVQQSDWHTDTKTKQLFFFSELLALGLRPVSCRVCISLQWPNRNTEPTWPILWDLF